MTFGHLAFFLAGAILGSVLTALYCGCREAHRQWRKFADDMRGLRW